jgi:hypothetical protein
MYLFRTLSEVRLIESWRKEYNEARPHSSLGCILPVIYAVQKTGRRSSLAMVPKPEGLHTQCLPNTSNQYPTATKTGQKEK